MLARTMLTEQVCRLLYTFYIHGTIELHQHPIVLLKLQCGAKLPRYLSIRELLLEVISYGKVATC